MRFRKGKGRKLSLKKSGPGQGFVIIEIWRKRLDKDMYKNGVGWESGSGQGFIYEGRGFIK